jgi:glycosyltransferase involved in cell wall biosynthesis
MQSGFKDMISVLICVYNGEEDIHRCIKSILDQTVQNFELILVDDCSTDNTSARMSVLTCGICV